MSGPAKYLDRVGPHFMKVVEANWATGERGDYLFIRAEAHLWFNGETQAWDDCVGGNGTSIYRYPLRDGKPNSYFDADMKAFGFDGQDMSTLDPARLIGQMFQADVKPHWKIRGSFEVGKMYPADYQGESKAPVKTVAVDEVAKRLAAAKTVPPARVAAAPGVMPPKRNPYTSYS